jgi:hypothetical protein
MINIDTESWKSMMQTGIIDEKTTKIIRRLMRGDPKEFKKNFWMNVFDALSRNSLNNSPKYEKFIQEYATIKSRQMNELPFIFDMINNKFPIKFWFLKKRIGYWIEHWVDCFEIFQMCSAQSQRYVNDGKSNIF